MGTLVLIRHGQSQWNLENRYTGWIDIPLTNRGRDEAKSTGRKIKEINFDVAFSSQLIRAVETLLLVLSESQSGKYPVFLPEGNKKIPWGGHYQPDPSKVIPVYRLPALNERHFGDVQGFDKEKADEKWGAHQIRLWRKSYEQTPPGGESLKDMVERIASLLTKRIIPYLIDERNVLLVAHGNILRALVAILEQMPADRMDQIDIPTGSVLVYETNATYGKFIWSRKREPGNG